MSTTTAPIITLIADILNPYSGLIVAIATVVLVVITWFYARSTSKMTNLMAKQVVADISISDSIIGIEEPFQNGKISENGYIRFRLVFDASNKNSGDGSIEKPLLILQLANEKQEYSIYPKTKGFELTSGSQEITLGSKLPTYEEIDLGGTIFLRGGEASKVELEYSLRLSKEFVEKIKDKINKIEYYLKYKDNMGRQKLIKIENIKKYNEVFRK